MGVSGGLRLLPAWTTANAFGMLLAVNLSLSSQLELDILVVRGDKKKMRVWASVARAAP
jgi:hypothetical protein